MHSSPSQYFLSSFPIHTSINANCESFTMSSLHAGLMHARLSVCRCLWMYACMYVCMHDVFLFQQQTDSSIIYQLAQDRQPQWSRRQTALCCDRLKEGAYLHIMMFKIHSNYFSQRREIDSTHFIFCSSHCLISAARRRPLDTIK